MNFKMAWYKKEENAEDFVIIGGLIIMQFVYAGNSIFLNYLMSSGVNPLNIVIFSAFATFLIMSPVAVCFERSKWPKELSLKLIIQLILISFGGVTLFQTLFLKGIKQTSPAMATAMPNLAPGLIFVIAWSLRLERVKLSCIYSKVKIVGTLLCVVGALIMSLMQSTSSAKESQFATSPPHVIIDGQKIIGCLYLMAAVFVMASNVVLQAITLGDFPAPMSMCAITSLIGVVITEVVQLIQNNKVEKIDGPLMSLSHLFGFSVLVGAMSGACVSFTGWAMKKRGPVLVSMFSPIGTVVSVVFSVINLGDTFNLGSLAGMFLMFSSLYFVLWAKGREGLANTESDEFGTRKPLLG